MTTEPIYIVDYFKTIVNSTSYELGFDIGYEYGHPLEINQTLVSLSKSNVSQKSAFPLIALFTDIEETKGDSIHFDSTISLQILIAQHTEMNLNSSERMEINFKPLLYPIYAELLNQIAMSKYFVENSVNQIKHVKTDRLYWGKSGIHGNDGLIFTDLLDCIELKNLSLTVRNKNC